MKALVLAPLGSKGYLVLWSRISGVRIDRYGVFSPINLLWDQVSQNEGAKIGKQEVTRFSNYSHTVNTSCLQVRCSIVASRVFPLLDNSGVGKQTNSHAGTPGAVVSS